jgi:hypothetical protein
VSSMDGLRYPTRLLSIGKQGEVRLVETDTWEKYPAYATLGEVYEDLSSFQLTASTALQLFDGVSDEALARVYRDAITAARFAELEYIWIEALCVIQDYAFDREIESSFLADVYAGSYLNISTTGSVGTSDGLFSPRIQRKVSFTLPISTDMLSQTSQQPAFWVEIGLNDAWEKKMEKAVVEKGQFLAGVDFSEKYAHSIFSPTCVPIRQFSSENSLHSLDYPFRSLPAFFRFLHSWMHLKSILRGKKKSPDRPLTRFRT